MLCISCKTTYSSPGDDLCEECAEIIREWAREKDDDPEFAHLLELDINWKQLDKVKKDAPEFLDNYLATLMKRALAERGEAPKWQRSSGEWVTIRDMNRFHLSGAMNRVHRFATAMMEEEGAEYFDAVPPVYWHLRAEMESRGMTIPRP